MPLRIRVDFATEPAMSDPSSNLSTGHVRFLGRSVREKQLQQRAGVFWLYGLSGSGKSTLAAALEKALHAEGRVTVILDGDLLRTGLNRGLMFSDDDRRENLRRAAEVARLLVQSGIIAICSFITPTKVFRSLARQIIGEDDFHEIYVHADFNTCRQRDVKGLYAKADQGQVKQFTGRDSGFEEPANPDLKIDTLTENEEESLVKLMTFVKSRIVLEG
ncbi:MAG TPA: adenylyl-sulfate kinase [Verrucomicrobiales bacterium]|jgi:adenylylsulfate kinase|nr:adenylyl-sulfate kinase [Verrucomicrobiales bacterium]